MQTARLKSTGEKIAILAENAGKINVPAFTKDALAAAAKERAKYVLVILPPQHPFHAPRIERVRRDSLRDIAGASA